MQMSPEHRPEANCQHHKCNDQCKNQDDSYCGSWNVNDTQIIMDAMMKLGCENESYYDYNDDDEMQNIYKLFLLYCFYWDDMSS